MYKSKLIFCSAEHQQFFRQMLSDNSDLDIYRIVFFYIMGLTYETRRHITQLYDFRGNCIHPEGMDGASWMTFSTRQVCYMAYNLYNGYVDDYADHYTPYYLFCTSFAPFFVCALQMLFSRYFADSHPEWIVEDTVWKAEKY